MSYDLFVWDGEAPASDAEAARIYERWMEKAEQIAETGSTPEPSDRIRAYVDGLLARWPEIDGDQPGADDNDGSPWAAAPLLSEALGAAIYFPVVWSRAEEASAFAADLAAAHGLHCFDPQSEQVRPISAGDGRVGGLRRWFRR